MITTADGPIIYEWKKPDGTLLLQQIVPQHLDLPTMRDMPEQLRGFNEVHGYRGVPGQGWTLISIWKKADVSSNGL